MAATQKQKLSRLKRVHKTARRKFGTPHCKKGKIIREGYHRKSYKRHSYKRKDGTKVHSSRVASVWVPPTCIKSLTGRPHGKQLFVLKEGELSKYGYSNVKNKSAAARHRALHKALKHINPLSVFRKINALKVLNKNKDPQAYKIFNADANWIKKTRKYKNRPTAD